MKPALALAAFALSITALTNTALPAAGRELWPAVPPEIGVYAPLPDASLPYRCIRGPVQNFYHGALYHELPAIYRGYAYRPYYRYTAARIVPRTYFCVEIY